MIQLPLTKNAGVLQVLSHPATTTASIAAGAAAPIIDAEKAEKNKKEAAAGVGPIADLASKTIGVLAHPAASTAATVGAVAAPFVADSINKKKEASFPKLAFVGAITSLMAKPAVAAGLNVLGISSMASSLMGGNNNSAAAAPPAKAPGRVGANATPSGAFSQGSNEGQAVTAGLITPQQTIPSELQITPNQTPPIGPTGPMGAGSNSASPPINPGKSKANPGATSAFKVSGWLDNPRLKRNLDLGSQAAVIGSAALPAYQLWRESRKEKQEEANLSTPNVRPVVSDDPRRIRVASMLPLQPKQPLLDRLGSGVRDFGEGAFNALDDQAEKQLTPSTTLDPLKTRTPSRLHLI
jgi:hypothetical protein